MFDNVFNGPVIMPTDSIQLKTEKRRPLTLCRKEN